jgi:AcrR family transcriptional regulator
MAPGVKARSYNSEGRRQGADERRRRIVAAARELFLERSYHGTTMDEIAAHAGVATETVYAAFGNKSRLLGRVMDIAIVGDEREVPLLEREWVREVRQEPDPKARLDRLCAITATVLSRVGPLHAAVRSALDGDAELAALKGTHDEMRLRGQLEFVRLLQDALRPELSLEAARDIYWALASPELHHLLTVDRGWSSRRYRQWLSSVLEPALLRPR